MGSTLIITLFAIVSDVINAIPGHVNNLCIFFRLQRETERRIQPVT